MISISHAEMGSFFKSLQYPTIDLLKSSYLASLVRLFSSLAHFTLRKRFHIVISTTIASLALTIAGAASLRVALWKPTLFSGSMIPP